MRSSRAAFDAVIRAAVPRDSTSDASSRGYRPSNARPQPASRRRARRTFPTPSTACMLGFARFSRHATLAKRAMNLSPARSQKSRKVRKGPHPYAHCDRSAPLPVQPPIRQRARLDGSASVTVLKRRGRGRGAWRVRRRRRRLGRGPGVQRERREREGEPRGRVSESDALANLDRKSVPPLSLAGVADGTERGGRRRSRRDCQGAGGASHSMGAAARSARCELSRHAHV
jgi:hypothetical protein